MKCLLITLLLITSGCFLQSPPSNNYIPHEDNSIQPLKGTIPLVVILSNSTKSEHKFQSKEEYRKLYSNFEGNDSRNAEEYFYNVSHGKFSFSFQDIWGPYDLPDKDYKKAEDEIVESIYNLYKDGFDFKFFDTNKDNILSSKELLITITSNATLYFGLTRGINLVLPNGLTINAKAAMVGSGTNLATIIHEIAHLFGAVDLYGSDCLNQHLTIMSCTVNSEQEKYHHFIVHLDPFHKIKLDWIEPRIVLLKDLEKEEKCFDVEVPQYRGDFSVENQRPLLLYDVDLRNYFLIEYRNKNISYSKIKSYDNGFPEYGVIVWIVSIGENGKLYNIPSIVENNKSIDKSVWVYSPENDRKSFIWKDGEVINPVYINGDSSSFIITTGNFKEHSVTAEICLSKK